MNLRQRGDFWYVTIQLEKKQDGFKNNGQPKFKYPKKEVNTYCTKRKDAQKKAIEIESALLDEQKNKLIKDVENITFANLLKIWLQNHVKMKCEETTFQSYQFVVDTHIIPYFGEQVKLQDLRPIDLQGYYAFLMRNGRADKKGALSSNTVIKHHANIHNALKYACKMELVNRNIAALVELPSRKKFIGDYCNNQETVKIIEAAKNTPMESVVMITAYLGLRRGEISGLKWVHVNLEEGIIKIFETRARFNKETITKSPKNDSSIRTLPIPSDLHKYLLRLRLKQKENKLKFGNTYCDDNYVCCWDDGKPLNLTYISKKFREILKKNDLKSIRFHDLRYPYINKIRTFSKRIR